MTKGRCLPGAEATVSLFIPLFAVNDEIGLVSVKYPPPLNSNDCQDHFHSRKDKQVRCEKLLDSSDRYYLAVLCCVSVLLCVDH